MKKFILVFVGFLLMLNVGFSFDVLDSDKDSRQYFSLSNYDVSISNVDNLSAFKIQKVGDDSTLRSYDLVPCLDKFCYDFSLLSYLSSVGLVLNSTEFVFTVGAESKTIYFDITKPTFVLENYVVDTPSKLLKTYFSYEDTFAVDKVEVFEIVSGSIKTFGELSSNSYEHSLTNSGSLTLRFKVIDMAGNYEEFDFDFDISDLFAPSIDDTFLIKEKNGVFKLEFDVSDSNNLGKYEVVKGDLKLTESLSGKDVSRIVTLPFTSGSVSLKVYDEFGNVASKSISLSSPLDMSFESEYSDNDEFVFESEAKSCRMISIDSENFRDTFDEDDEEFSVDLDLDDEGKYELEFYCEDNNFKGYYSRDFYLDTTDPSSSDLSLIVLSDGNIKLTWDESEDDLGSVEYELYRDDKLIFDGSREEYIDRAVDYPNSYEYYLVVLDEAGNSVESEVASGVPKKMNVELTSNLPKEKSVSVDSFSFNVYFEKDASVDVLVKNLGSEVYKNSISSSSDLVKVKLSPGVNEIIVTAKDDLSNSKTLSGFVTYDKPVVIAPVVVESNTPVKESTEVPVKSVTSGSNVVSANLPQDSTDTKSIVKTLGDEDTGLSYWIWFGIFLVVLLAFVWVFIINQSELHKRIKASRNAVNSVKSKKSRSANVPAKSGFSRGDEILVKRRTDAMLHRSLKKVREDRSARHKEKLRTEKENKLREEKLSNRTVSDLEKSKFNDLKKKRFSFDVKHNSSDNSSNNEREVFKAQNVESVSELDKKQMDEAKSAKGRGFLEGILNKFGLSRVEPTEKDVETEKFLGYIGSQRSRSSWDDTNTYRQSHHDKIAAKKLAKQQAVEEQKRMELRAQQEKLDEKNKILAKKQHAKHLKQEFKHHRKVARDGLDDYLSKRSSKRKFWFAEKAVNKDISSRSSKK